MKTPFVTVALVGALANAFDFDWADDILDFSSYNLSSKPKDNNYSPRNLLSGYT